MRSGVNTSVAGALSRSQAPPLRVDVMGVIRHFLRAFGSRLCHRSQPDTAGSWSRSPSQALEESRSPHPTAHAHGDETISCAAALHFVEDCRRELCAGAAERVSERNGAAVDVHTLGVDVQLAETGEHL